MSEIRSKKGETGAKKAEMKVKEAAERGIRQATWEKEILLGKIRLGERQNLLGSEQAADGEGAQLSARGICPRKLLAPFDKKRDNVDALLNRFKRITRGEYWATAVWVTTLRLSLMGYALPTYARVSREECLNNEKVKVTLLSRLRLKANGIAKSTERVWRKRLKMECN